MEPEQDTPSGCSGIHKRKSVLTKKPLNFICNICRKGFAQRRYLKNHQKRCALKSQKGTVAPKNKLECSMCGKEFQYLSQLQRHQLAHLGARNFDCSLCQRQFVNKSHLERHLSTVHRSETDAVAKFNCDKCAKSFPTQWELNRHERSVHPTCIECIPCSTDQKSVLFYSISDWQSHMKFHWRKNAHLCTDCGRSFRQKSDFDAHRAAKHDKSARFQCSKCDKLFVQRVQVDRHITKKHLEVQCYGCAACSKIYKTENQFLAHMKRRHTKEKVHVCKYCKNYFMDSAVYFDHIAQEHFRKLDTPVSLNFMNQAETSEDPPSTSTESDSPEIATEIEKQAITVELRLKIYVEQIETEGKELNLGSFLPTQLVEFFPQLQTLQVTSEEGYSEKQVIMLKLPLKSDREIDENLREMLSNPIEISYKPDNQ